jgi:type IV pilus assembly protein PilP
MKKSLVIWVLGLLVIGGCSEKEPEKPAVPPKAPINQPVKALSPTPVPGQTGPVTTQGKSPSPALPEKSSSPQVVYDPRGKADPFIPAEVFPEGKAARVLPLEQFEISDYELVGIVSGAKIKKAMLQDLSGKGYLVQVGTTIGKRGGKIIRIADREINIEEPFQDFFGRKIVRQISLKMPKVP